MNPYVPDNTGAVIVVVRFRYEEDTGLNTEVERWPVVAWWLHHAARPVSVADLPMGDDDAKWFLELPESCAPNRWALPNNDRFDSEAAALNHLCSKWCRRRLGWSEKEMAAL